MNVTTDSFVTVVSGLPRTGTSMMMQMLEAGGIPAMTDHQRVADDDNLRGYYEMEAVKRTRQDASWLEQAPGKVVKLIYMLLYDLPDNYSFRVVFMNRDLDEVIASQNAMLKRRGESGAGVADAEMKRIFRSQLDKVKQWLSTQENFAVLDLDYAETVNDPAQQVSAICEFLGKDMNAEQMIQAVFPELHRQRSAAQP